MAKLTFELVSPDRLLMALEADMVSMPGLEGDFGILPGHAPLITALRPGVIEVEGAEEVSGDAARVFVAGGFAEIAGDRLTVLAEEAVAVADLDREDLQQRLQNAREDLEDATDEDARRRAQGMIDHLQDLLAAVN